MPCVPQFWVQRPSTAARPLEEIRSAQRCRTDRIDRAAVAIFRAALGLALGLALGSAARAAALPPLSKAQWVWSQDTSDQCDLRKAFTLDSKPTEATVLITADNGYDLYVNGARVGSDTGAAAEVWKSVERYDITSRLMKGRNIIGIHGTDLGGVRAVVAAVSIEVKGRPPLDFVTDGTWRAASGKQAVDCSHPEFVEGPDWRDARVVGPMGVAPWGVVAWSDAVARVKSSAAAPRIELAAPDENFQWPQAVAFIGNDCSVYVPLRADAWGVAFRVGDWSRAYTEFDLPCPSKIGRKLHILKPGAGATPRVLLDAGAGVIGSPSATFDGKALLVAAALGGEKFFHIYRVPREGGTPHRLTDGSFHDIDPAELPDGRIVFTSTRVGTFEDYHQPPSRALFRMNADGSGIHPITSTLIFDNEPKVMADGRIAFIRTDNFFDRGKVETHLHTMRPDGTDGLTEVGANVGSDYGVRLRAFGYGSPAPLPDGRLAFISNRGNFIAAPGGRERDFHRLPDQLGDLAPLPDGRLLCTVLRPDGKQIISDVVGVINPRDNRVVSIFQSSNGAIHSPVFVGPRPRPPVIPDFVDAAAAQPSATGFLLCQDARVTTKSKADWERIRAIRVLGAVPLTTRSSHSHIVHIGHETVELGTVPLAADGSFFVEVPADMPIALQAVDAEGRSELNEMSWLYVRPGERRSCIGCHQPREAAPTFTTHAPEALLTSPVKLLGQGDPHRFRGNNPGVTGMMDLQFERFRECASLNRSTLRDSSEATGRGELAALINFLRAEDDALKISSAQRLALRREREAAPALAENLKAQSREVRVAAALALAACGTRESVPALLGALKDADAVVAQSAIVALENLTGHAWPRGDWPNWFATNSWITIETALVSALRDSRVTSSAVRRSTVVALGHTGGDAARAVLREWVAAEARTNPYPPFTKNNRTDNFTFSAASPLNPRTLQEAVRALGQLRDTNALPLLRELLAKNIEPQSGNLFLVEAAVEALGRIGAPEAETVLLETFASMKDYWHYVGWYSDHPALYACHSSPVHARIIEALDRIGSTRAAGIIPQLIRSVPTDPDRGLFLQNDDYETLAGRLIRRSGRGPEVIESCLALLGDPLAKPAQDVKSALSTTHPAWGGHPGPENRAAQILSLTCRDSSSEPRVRVAFERFRALPEEPIKRELGNPTWTPVRHWTLFYLARALGNLHDPASVGALTAVLADNLNEARHGRPDPATPEIHFLHLDYTPCWRAAAAWALGQIRDRRAVPALLGAVRNRDNATDVRHAAARALGQLSDSASVPALRELAAIEPEVSTRRALLSACEAIAKGRSGRRLAGLNPKP
ncbi:MAG: HEAT repeat domain-containing protein [Verrucomicrobia bacterium]|nr:HEAT repeat domain-containing protein [Verrucomicrobiota bacterium]